MSTRSSIALAAVIIAGICIMVCVAGATAVAITGNDIPQSLAVIYGGVITGFVTAIAGFVNHTLGFNNGTVNGEAQAQAIALRVAMGTDTKGHTEDKT